MAAHSRILTWRIQGQRSLAGYSANGGKESDTSRHEPSHPFSSLIFYHYPKYSTHPILPLPAISSPELALLPTQVTQPKWYWPHKAFSWSNGSCLWPPTSFVCIQTSVYRLASHSSRADLAFIWLKTLRAPSAGSCNDQTSKTIAGGKRDPDPFCLM